MKVYVVELKEKAPRSISDILFPLITKHEFGTTYNYSDAIRNENGKPQPVASHYFSISHCKNYWCVVFSKEECGIDIESSDRIISPRLERRILAANERPLNGNPLKTWVLKEAYVKYLGQGIGMGLKSITADNILRDNFVADLTTESFVCFAIQHNITRLKTVIASWSDSQLLL